jgi:hypothetical protein
MFNSAEASPPSLKLYKLGLPLSSESIFYEIVAKFFPPRLPPPRFVEQEKHTCPPLFHNYPYQQINENTIVKLSSRGGAFVCEAQVGWRPGGKRG